MAIIDSSTAITPDFDEDGDPWGYSSGNYLQEIEYRFPHKALTEAPDAESEPCG